MVIVMVDHPPCVTFRLPEYSGDSAIQLAGKDCVTRSWTGAQRIGGKNSSAVRKLVGYVQGQAV